MPLIGVSIEKETTFHGKAERFSNQYYYDCGASFGEANALSLINQLTAAEKLIHTPLVAFKLGRLWSAGGTPAQNQQLALVDLTGNGTMTNSQDMAAEAAVLIEWECSRKDIRGRKVYLRKFVRCQGLAGAGPDSANQKAALTASQSAPFETYADDVESFTIGVDVIAALCSETRNFPLGVGVGRTDPFVRTREFRRN